MTIGFKTKTSDGELTHFVQKILACVIDEYSKAFTPKPHSIRKGKRFYPGVALHMATGVRTKNYFQFNKGIEGLEKCKSVQDINIQYINKCSGYPIVTIDGKFYSYHNTKEAKTLDLLAKNDGFADFDAFCKWFDTDFEGQIIHWTDFKY